MDLKNNTSLKNKVAIVTGASRGIGKAIAIELASRGTSVVLAAKTIDPNPKLPGTLEDVKREIESKGGRAFIQQTDVRSDADVEALITKTVAELGGIDILINNAGALYWADVENTPMKRFDLVMGVNVRASFACAHFAIPHMKKRGGGHIINMSPPVSENCVAGRVAYMISKFGMSMLTEGLAKEVGASNIKVHSLWPVTMVESQATIGNHLGEPEMWRKASILVDSTLGLLTGEANIENGRCVYDEEVLTAMGVKDFGSYACVEGKVPPPLRLDDPTGYWQKYLSN
ncbi:MAG: SDR family oxidoreductase [Polyangiaceae bacterium]|nr:SDR family oxidoreductase [Polyangiaceae bacterium]